MKKRNPMNVQALRKALQGKKASASVEVGLRVAVIARSTPGGCLTTEPQVHAVALKVGGEIVHEFIGGTVLRDGLLHCSFCDRSQNEVVKLIAGMGVHICNECVGICNEIIAEDDKTSESVEAVETAKSAKSSETD